ncbi:hypothetical protein ACROYT_G014872 [Oculina patagonica]
MITYTHWLESLFPDIFLEVQGKITLYGEGVSMLNEQEFIDQICPKPNSDERKYVRIKTVFDSYVWAEPIDSGEGSYLQTFCWRDREGRTEVTEPGKRTTFLVHCQRANNQNVFRFEVLSSHKNTPSGYYFYADPDNYETALVTRKLSPGTKHAHRFNFIIKRWRGPVVAIQTQGKAGATKENEKSMWLRYTRKDGYAADYVSSYRKQQPFPNFTDMFSLEAGIA